MSIHLAPISADDRVPVIDIFNYYVENGFAAYPETTVPYDFYDLLLKMISGYPAVLAKDHDGQVLGFGMLRAHNPLPTFSQTAEITYFIEPGSTGKGIGRLMLDHLVGKATERGITSILASISSLNEGSLRFHEKNGFVECGRFRGIGKKNGQEFDVVWMQRPIHPER